jgi:cysteine-S-conjugate beta-lyase
VPPFDAVGDRLAWSATKWEKYRGKDVIPLWIADMDFAVSPAIQTAVAAHAMHGNYGYMSPPHDLPQALVDYHERHYDWRIEPEWIVWLSGLVLGINLAVKACCAPGEKAMTFSPVYPPFLNAPGLQGREAINVPLAAGGADGMRYEIDFARLEASLTSDTRLLLLCHPHNPIGRLFSRAELDRLADFCTRHNLYVCSDEVHSDLILDGETKHVPFAKTLAERSPAMLKRTITLSGPGKTYNIAGLGVAWAVIPDPELRARFRASMQKLVPDASCFGFTALRAALQDSEDWRQQMLAYLRKNREAVVIALKEMGLPHTYPEASYLIWIDARKLAERVGDVAAWFEQAGVALSDGKDFGQAGFLRLNFACPTSILDNALSRMRGAVEKAGRTG